MSEPTPRSLEHHAALDARLVAAARGIRLLEAVSWPEREQAMFLGAWRVGRIHLPDHEYPRGDHAERRRELQAVFDAADPDDPLGRYLRSTADSWITTTHLLDALGTPAVTEHSARLFGRPVEELPGGGITLPRNRSTTRSHVSGLLATSAGADPSNVSSPARSASL